MAHILVVDDDTAITNVLRRGLGYEGFSVAIAHSGTEAVEYLKQHQPDLIVLDIMLPGLNGLEVLERARAVDPQQPILLLTARDTPADQVSGLARGADDYVTKPFTFEVLLARIRALLRRHQADRPPVLRFADLTLDTASRRAQRGGRDMALTITEYNLLEQFMLHPRQVLSRDLLMERVWEYDFGGNTNVLETYIKQLRQKLETDEEPRLIHTMYGVGYVLREE
jgi:two-component system response regulator MprA